MKSVFCCLLLLICLQSSAQNIHELDKKNGFKNYKLGTDIAQYDNKDDGKNGFPLDDEVGDYMSYCKSYNINKHFSVGDLSVSYVNIFTLESKIIRIDVGVDHDQTKEYIKLYTMSYGKPSVSDGSAKYYRFKKYTWKGKTTRLVLRDISEKYSTGKSTTVSYVSLPLLNQLLLKDQKENSNRLNQRKQDL